MRQNFVSALGKSRLYPITDRNLSGLSHEEQVRRLAQLGVPLIQLREKNLSALEFFEDAKQSLRIARELGTKVIINDRVDIALALEADGVHLGQDDMPAEAARRILGEEVIIGFSTHNLEQAHLATKLPIDYLAVGPIFVTTTKEEADPPIGLQVLREIRHAIGDLPLVAIGGITSANASEVIRAGADFLAVISQLWRAEELAHEVQRLSNP